MGSLDTIWRRSEPTDEHPGAEYITLARHARECQAYIEQKSIFRKRILCIILNYSNIFTKKIMGIFIILRNGGLVTILCTDSLFFLLFFSKLNTICLKYEHYSCPIRLINEGRKRQTNQRTDKRKLNIFIYFDIGFANINHWTRKFGQTWYRTQSSY